MPSYVGIVKDRTIQLTEGPMPLPDGTRVLVTPIGVEVGTPAALLAAMQAEPHLEPGDVEELNRLIAEGSRGRSRVEPFPETPGKPEMP